MLKYFKNITLLLIALLHGLFSMLCNILSNKTITIYISLLSPAVSLKQTIRFFNAVDCETFSAFIDDVTNILYNKNMG